MSPRSWEDSARCQSLDHLQPTAPPNEHAESSALMEALSTASKKQMAPRQL